MSAKAIAIDRKSLPVSELSPVEVCDEYGDLDLRKQQRKPEEDRYVALKARVQELTVALPAAEAASVAGKRWVLQLSARETVRELIDIGALYKFVCARSGLKYFLCLCKVPFGSIDKENIPSEKLALMVATAQTGSRRIKAVLKALPEAA